MAWDWRTTGAVTCCVVCAAVASCSGNEFQSAIPGSGGSTTAGSAVTAGADSKAGKGNGAAGSANGAGGNGANGTGGNGANAGNGDSGVAGNGGNPPNPTDGGMPGVEPGEAGAAGAGETEPGTTISTDGLIYWFKADAGVTLANGYVSAWKDYSGNGYDAKQGITTQRPKVATSELLPLPVLQFDGGDFLQLPAIDPPIQHGMSFFAVAAHQEQHCAGILELSNAAEHEDVHFGPIEDRLLFEIAENPRESTALAFPVDTISLVAGLQTDGPPTSDATNPQIEMFVNGTFAGNSAVPAPVAMERVNNFIGTSLYNDCTPLKGAIAEIIFYGRYLDMAERKAVESYLTKKWKCCD